MVDCAGERVGVQDGGVWGDDRESCWICYPTVNVGVCKMLMQGAADGNRNGDGYGEFCFSGVAVKLMCDPYFSEYIPGARIR